MSKEGGSPRPSPATAPGYSQRQASSAESVDRALSEQLESSRGIIAAMKDGFSVLDVEGVHLDVNDALCEMTGFSREELVGAGPPHPYWPPECYEDMEKAFRKTRRGEFSDFEFTFMRKNGERFPVILSPSQLKDEKGKARAYFATIKDITEIKKVEEALRESESRVRRQTAELQQKVDERTAELGRLNEELERSNSELEQFAYVASHDLQEPLRMVSGYVQLLARRYGDRLDADAGDFIGFAVDGANRMQRMIVDLLAFSRVRTHSHRLEPIAAQAALVHALENLRESIRESGAKVSHGRMPKVMADETQLTQLFQNLIGNAVKFRADEPPLVRVSAEKRGSEWVFAVEDNGIGVEPEHLDRIFLVFQKLHTDEQYSGTGIGLAMCQKIVECHGGRMWVESESGKGSTFYFTLPGVRDS